MKGQATDISGPGRLNPRQANSDGPDGTGLEFCLESRSETLASRPLKPPYLRGFSGLWRKGSLFLATDSILPGFRRFRRFRRCFFTGSHGRPRHFCPARPATSLPGFAIAAVTARW